MSFSHGRVSRARVGRDYSKDGLVDLPVKT
jgi:hypothetical protein